MAPRGRRRPPPGGPAAGLGGPEAATTPSPSVSASARGRRQHVQVHVGQLGDEPLDDAAAQPLDGAAAEPVQQAGRRGGHDQLAGIDLADGLRDHVGRVALSLEDPRVEGLLADPRGDRGPLRRGPDDQHGAGRAAAPGQPLAVLYQGAGPVRAGDGDQHVLGLALALALAVGGGQGVGDETQADLAQRGQPGGLELGGQRRPDLVGRVDVAVAQALAQRLGRAVHELDRVGGVQHLVGDRGRGRMAGDGLDGLGGPLHVGHVGGGDDVDPGLAQRDDARRVPAEVVDEGDAGLAGQHGRGVHVAGVVQRRDDLQAADGLDGPRPAAGVREADHHVLALGPQRAALAQHGERLARAGGRAQVDRQGAAPGGLLLGQGGPDALLFPGRPRRARTS